MLLVPWAEKLLVCACGEEFDKFEEVKAHANSGVCPINPPEATSAWQTWIMSGPGKRTWKPPMSEEKKAEMKKYNEEHKEEIAARRRLRNERRRRIIEATMRGGRKRGKTVDTAR